MADDPDSLRRFSQALESGNELWRSWTLGNGGDVIFMAGGEFKLKVPADKLKELPGLRDQYAKAVGVSVSLGLGGKMREADRALEAVKEGGGDAIRLYDETVDKELDGKKELSKADEQPKTIGAGTAEPQEAQSPEAPGQEKAPQGQEDVDPGQLHDMLGQIASQQGTKDKAEADAAEGQKKKSSQQDQMRSQVAAILKVFKDRAPELEQIQQQDPELYQGMVSMLQTMTALARESLASQMTKSELQKAVQSSLEKSENPLFRLPRPNEAHPHDDAVWFETLPQLMEKGRKDALKMYKPEDPGFPEAKKHVDWAYSKMPNENWSLWTVRQHRLEPKKFDANAISELEHFAGSQHIPDVAAVRFEKHHSLEEGLGMLKAAEKQYVDRQKNSLKLAPKPATAKKLLDFDDGYSWWDLGRGSCSEEGKAMGHCGNVPSQKPGDSVLSLRKEHVLGGNKYYEPHITFIRNGNILGEMKGRGNERPAPHYHDKIVALINQENLLPVGGGYAPQNNFALDHLSPELRSTVNPNIEKAGTDVDIASQFKTSDGRRPHLYEMLRSVPMTTEQMLTHTSSTDVQAIKAIVNRPDLPVEVQHNIIDRAKRFFHANDPTDTSPTWAWTTSGPSGGLYALVRTGRLEENEQARVVDALNLNAVQQEDTDPAEISADILSELLDHHDPKSKEVQQKVFDKLKTAHRGGGSSWRSAEIDTAWKSLGQLKKLHPDIQRKIFNTGTQELQATILRRDDTPEDIVHEFFKTINPTTSALPVFRNVSKDLATKPYLTLEEQDILSRFGDKEDVADGFAQNSAIHPSIINKMALDAVRDPKFQYGVTAGLPPVFFAHPALTRESLNEILGRVDQVPRHIHSQNLRYPILNMLSNPNLDPKIAAKYVDFPSEGDIGRVSDHVRMAMQNPSLPLEKHREIITPTESPQVDPKWKFAHKSRQISYLQNVRIPQEIQDELVQTLKPHTAVFEPGASQILPTTNLEEVFEALSDNRDLSPELERIVAHAHPTKVGGYTRNPELQKELWSAYPKGSAIRRETQRALADNEHLDPSMFEAVAEVYPGAMSHRRNLPPGLIDKIVRAEAAFNTDTYHIASEVLDHRNISPETVNFLAHLHPSEYVRMKARRHRSYDPNYRPPPPQENEGNRRDWYRAWLEGG